MSEPCSHGELTTDVVRSSIQCRKCGAFATLATTPPQPSAGLREALDVIDAEIARRRSPDYQRFAKPSESQTPAERTGQAGVRGHQHGELVGLVQARELIAAVSATPDTLARIRALLDDEEAQTDMGGAQVIYVEDLRRVLDGDGQG